ncbi:MAG: DUF929 family protein [Candidatus Micrarchaeia archaeon]
MGMLKWIFLIVAVIGVFSVLFVLSKNVSSYSVVKFDNVEVSQAILSNLSIPNSLSNNIGIGTASYSVISKISSANELMLNNKPEILYMGAEYCPFCAAERWALIIALSRFGTFSNLHYMTSSVTDYSPSTPTFTFYNSTYTSNYISFVSVEQTTNQPANGSYAKLQTPNVSEYNLMAQYDGGGSIPFVLFANKSVLIGATYDPESVLDGRNWSVVASDLHNASSLQAQAIIGSANLLTTQICEADNNTPQSVCSQQYVKNIEKLS